MVFFSSFVISRTKHVLHCCAFISFILLLQYVNIGIITKQNSKPINPFEKYGTFWTILLYVLRLPVILLVPQNICQFLGLVLYNAFPPDPVQLQIPINNKTHLICIRVVTRGDYPELVNQNIERNLSVCSSIGLDNVVIEVVTEKSIDLIPRSKVREIVVPPDYQTKRGSLFKARALQYCLEDEVNHLDDDDWIVHLDEETLITRNAIIGILNFINAGNCDFGQGLITYGNEEIVNWVATMADTYRVAEDMGKLRLQLACFNRPLFGWKGSFNVSRVSAERAVSFDNGPDCSMTEDCFFALKADTKGYSFNFIDGEMWEKSPFTLLDFIKQRKRWLQGQLRVIRSHEIPIKNKFWFILLVLGWASLPLSSVNIYVTPSFPIPCPVILEVARGFVESVSFYMYFYGTIKSLPLKRYGVLRAIMCVLVSLVLIPVNIGMESVAVTWGLFSYNSEFHVVEKQFKPTKTGFKFN